MDNNQNSNTQPGQPSPTPPLNGAGADAANQPTSTPISQTTSAASAGAARPSGNPLSGISQRKRSLTRRAILIAVGALIVLAAVTGGVIALTSKTVSNTSTNPLDNFATSQVPSSALNGLGSAVSLQGQLIVNGQLKVNGTEILTPQATPPANPVNGQVYVDQNGVMHVYSNGSFKSEVQTIQNNIQPVTVTNNSIGVGSLQGQSGALNLGAGRGISISGLNISNSGVISLTGGSGAQVTNDGNGNYTVSTTVTGAYVKSLGGASGDITVGSGLLMNGQQIQNSGVLSIGGTGGAFTLGTGLQLSNGTIKNIGVTSLGSSGGTIQISNPSGTVNLDLPQSIASSATPTFQGINLTNGLAVSSGGTGRTDITIPDKDLLVGTGGSSYALKTLTGGTGVTINNSNPNTIEVDVSANCTPACANTSLNNIASVAIPSGVDLLPATGATVSLGSSSNAFANLFLTGAETLGGSLTIGGNITPTAALTVGAIGQSLTLQGNATALKQVSGSNSTTVNFTAPTAANTISFPNASGTVAVSASGNISLSAAGNITFTGTLPITNGGTGISTTPTDGQLLIGNSLTNSYDLATLAQTGGITITSGHGTISLEVPKVSGCSSSCADASLDNLAGVAINTSLLPGNTTVDLGSRTAPFQNLYVGGTANSNFEFTGTATTGRTITLDDKSGTLALVQTAGSSVAQTGDFNVSNNLIAGNQVQAASAAVTNAATAGNFVSSLFQTADTSAASTSSTAATFRSGNATGTTAGSGNVTVSSGTATSNSGNLTLTTGTATGTSGNLTIDTGAGTSANGTLAIGTTNAASTTIGRSSATLTLQGNGSTALAATSGGKTTTIGFTGFGNNVVYNFDSTGVSAGTYQVCTSAAGSCSSVYSGFVQLQASTPGTQQTGNLNISGTAIFGVNVVSPLVQTADTNAASTNSAGITLRSGNAAGTTSNSGNVTIDSGTATGTAGTVAIGTINASAVSIGTSANITTVQGAAAIQGASLTLGKGGPSGVTGSIIFQDAADAHTVTLQAPASNVANAIINIPSAAGTLAVSASGNITLSAAGNITFTGTLPIANGGTGIATVPSANGQLLIGAAGGTYSLGTLTSPGSTITVGYTGGNITLDTNVGCTACAKTDLSNLAATTAINNSLLPGTAGTLNLGSASKNYANLFLGTTANQAFDITGTVTEPATTRTLTLDDLTAATQHIVIAQSGTPAIQNGGINLSGNITGANIIATGQLQSPVLTSGDGTNTALIIRSGTNNGGTSGNLTLQSGNTSNGTSGNVSLDAGTGTTQGTVTIGGSNASALILGRSGLQASLPGGLTTNGSGITTANGNLTLGSGNLTTTGTINSQTISSAANFTGTVAIQGANALTLGTASTNNGAIVFQNSGGANTVTLQASATNPASNLTLTLPSALSSGCLNITSGGQIGIQGCSSGLGGSGTANTIALFGAGGTSVANSILTEPTASTIALGGASLTIGVNGASGTLGSLVLNDGSNPGRAVTVSPQAAGSSYTLELPTTSDVGSTCLQLANVSAGVDKIQGGSCAAGGSGGNVTASGTTQNHLAVFTNNGAAYTVAASLVQDNGSAVGINTAPSATVGQILTVGSSNAFSVTDAGAATAASITNNGGYTQTGTGNFNASGSTGTFATSTGNVTLNGNTTVASGETFTVNGLTLNTQATNSVGSALFNATVTKNDSLTKTFDVMHIQPTINTGASNTTTTLNVLNIDTTNTATTGVNTTNLLRLGYGGTTELTVNQLGNEFLNGNLQVKGLTTAGAVMTDASGNISSVAALPVTAGGTGSTAYAQDGQLLIGNTTLNGGNGGYNVATLTAGAGVTIVNGHGAITISAPTAGTCPTNSCADISLDNLSATNAINTSLLAGNTSVDLGSASTPFRNLYLGGTATNNFKFTGTASAARTLTLDDKSGTVALIQTAGSSVAQTGDLNVSNNLIAGNQVQAASASITNAATAGSFVSALYQSADTNAASTNSSGITVRSGNAAGATSNSGNLTLTTGTATGTSGNVSIDAGAGTAANGTIAIGGTNAASTTVGRSGAALTLQGNGSTALTATSGGKTTTIGFTGFSNNVAYNFDTTGVTAGSYQVCTSAMNTCNTAGSGFVQLQSSTPGTQQTGSLNVSGTAIFGTGTITPLVQTTDTNSPSTNSTGLTLRSGNAAGATSNSGNVSVDAGTATGTAGTVSLGATNASAVTIGTATNTTTIQGSAAVQGSNLTLGKSGPSGTTGSIVFNDAADAHAVTLQAPASNAANVTINIPSAAGTMVVSGTSLFTISAAGQLSLTGVVPIANGGTNLSTAPSANGQLLIGTSGGAYGLGTITSPGSTVTVGYSGGNITLDTNVGCTTCAKNDLSNLAATTAISSSLLPGTAGTLNLGSAGKNYANLFIGSAGNQAFDITGTVTEPSTTRVLNLDDLTAATQHIVIAQSGTPATQSGGINLSGDVVSGGNVQGANLNVLNTSTGSVTTALVQNNQSTYTGTVFDVQSNISGSTASRFNVTQNGTVNVAGGTLKVNTINSYSGNALTIGATTDAVTVQASQSGGVTFKLGSSGQDQYVLPTGQGLNGASPWVLCTTFGNCAGTGNGVTSPTNTVNHLARFTAAGVIGNSILQDDGTNLGINTSPVSGVRMTLQGATSDNTTAALNATENNGTSALYVRNDGHVGVDISGTGATAGPETALDVNGTEQLRRINDATSGTQQFNSNILQFQGSYWNGTAAVSTAFKMFNQVVSSSQQILKIQDNSGNDLFGLTNGGSLGIGAGAATSPTSALDVNGAVTYRGMGTAPAVAGTNNGRIYFDTTTGKFKVSEGNGAYQNLVPGASWLVGGNNFGSDSIDNIGSTTNTAIGFLINSAEKARLDTNGNFLIGTQSGSNTLTVQGTSLVSTTTANAAGTYAANTYNVTNGCTTCSATLKGLAVALSAPVGGTSGTDTNIGLDLSVANTGANNSFTAINVGSNFNNILTSGNYNLAASGVMQDTGTVPASGTQSLVQLGTAISGGSANGTYLSTNNTCTTSCADLVNLQNNSTSEFKVTSGGATTTNGALTVNSGGAAITGNSSVTGTLGVSNTLTVSAGGAAITGNSSVTGTLGASSTFTDSATGAVAVSLTGAPAASGTSSLVQVGSALNGGSANGTYLGINSGNGYTGNFVDFQNFGTKELQVGSNGSISILGAGSLTVSSGGASFTAGGSNGITLNNNTLTSSATSSAISLTGTPTSSASAALLSMGASFAAGSANGTYLGINAASGFTGNLIDAKVNGGTSLFKVDSSGNGTFNGNLTVGTATNGVTFTPASAPSSANPLYHGTAQPTKTINLTAEYAGAVLDTGGATSDIGTMTSGFDSTAKMNFYDWTTSQSSAQTYDIVVQVPVPQDFSSWGTASINVCSSHNTATDIQATITDTAGTAQTTQSIANTSGGAAPCTTYTASSLTMSGAYTPGQSFFLRLHLSSQPSGDVRVGNIKLNYLSNF